MKDCNGCKYANWRKTAAGRLHPSGDGMCEFPWKMPPLPASRYFIGGAPKPSGGGINRREEFKDHCPHYQAESKGDPR